MGARKYVDRAVSLDDLEQAVTLGLIHALDRFDPGQDGDFPSYAAPMISGEVQRYLRAPVRTVPTVPSRMSIWRAVRRLLTSRGRG